MPDTLRRVSHELSSVSIDHLRVTTDGRIGVILRKAHTVDGGPLLKLLSQVGILDKRVRRAMERLHAGVAPIVAGIHGAHLRGPLLARLHDQPVGTRGIGADGARAGRARETARRDARVARGGGEEVRVRGRQHVGHHAARRAARDEDALGVGAVLADGVADHVGQAGGVAAAVAGQAGGSGDVPAVEVAGGRRVDHDKGALCVGEGDVLCLPAVGCAGAPAAVEGEDDGGGGGEVWGHGDVHCQTCWVGAKVCDALEGCVGLGCQREGGDEEGEGMHVWRGFREW